nr:formylglycine-generating enzyme family protein [Lysobacter sp. CAU 1642]
MVVLPIGSFTMGSPSGEADRKSNEGPTRTVNIAKAIAMARTEITVNQFRAFVRSAGYTPTSTRNNRSTIYDERAGQMGERGGVTWESDHAGNPADGNMPVVHVSWTDAKSYANWLASQSGQTYRLPSEAEFEYAMRAGGQTRYWWGEEEPDRVVANLTGERDRSASGRNWVNSFDNYGDGYWGAAPVGSFETNRFGLHDMGGNVSEWVEDCWHENYQRAPSDGSAWVNEGCNRRVIRGASWASAPDQARSAFRLTAGEGTTNARLGFRVVREL